MSDCGFSEKRSNEFSSSKDKWPRGMNESKKLTLEDICFCVLCFGSD